MLFSPSNLIRRAVSKTLRSHRNRCRHAASLPATGRRRQALRPIEAPVEILETRTMLSAPDPLESNDTLATAYDMGTVTGHTDLDEIHLSIHETDDEDWFRFETTATTAEGHFIAIDFDHDDGDLDIELYDETETFVAGSFTVSDHEEVRKSGLPAGVYFLRVYGFSGATNSDYVPSFSAPTPDGDFAEPNDLQTAAHELGIVEDSHEWDDLSIHDSDDVDWFAFETQSTATGAHFVGIEFENEDGDLDFELFDANGDYLAGSYSVDGSEVIPLEGLEAGTYYAKVYGFDGDTNPEYELFLDAPQDSTSEQDAAEPNDSPGTAFDLGTVDGTFALDDLSIHAAGNEDWFTFDTLATGGAGSSVSIEFYHHDGDLDFELYDAAGDYIDGSYDVENHEEISLHGLSAGGYQVLVYGFDDATNPEYSLEVRMHDSDSEGEIESDFAEANDSSESAYDLRALEGLSTWDGLSIHEAGNEDWFEFQTVTTGGPGSSVSIDFYHADGDLDLELYNSQGDYISGSYDVENHEHISLDSLAGGTYSILVYGFGDATSPEYSLTIDAPEEGSGEEIEPDFSEPNDTLETAHDLRTLDGFSEWDGLSIHSNQDVDWFRFETVAQGTEWNMVSTFFWHAEGDLDLELYDSAGELIESSEGAWGHESISLQGLAAGTYFLKIAGYNGATNSEYGLTISAPEPTEADFAEENNSIETAYDLRAVQGYEMWDNLSIHESGDEDWFRFETQATGNEWHHVAVSFWGELGDLDLALYDAEGESIDHSDGVSDFESVSLDGLPAATYFARVTGFDGSTSPEYWLEIISPEEGGEPDFAEPNDTAEHAYDLRMLEGQHTWGGLSIHEADNEDWFEFQIIGVGDADSSVSIDFHHEDGDLDLELFDANGEFLDGSYSVENHEYVTLQGLEAGLYRVSVYGFSGDTTPAYSLTVQAPHEGSSGGADSDFAEPNDSLETAYDLRTLDGPHAWDGLSIHEADNEDWFVFQTVGVGQTASSVSIDFQHADGDLDLELFDANGEFLDGSYSVENHEQVTLHEFDAGTFYVLVYGFDGNTIPAYSLTVHAPEESGGGEGDFAEPNDQVESAFDLRVVEGQEEWDDLNIHSPEDEDYFRFETVANGNIHHFVGIEFDHEDGDLDIELYDEHGNWLDSSYGVTDWEEISLAEFPAGTYHLLVYGFAGATNSEYEITISAPEEGDPGGGGGGGGGGYQPDRFEPNEGPVDAHDLRTVTGHAELEDLSIHNSQDVDWFRFETVAQASDGHYLRIGFEHNLGDLDFMLSDANGMIAQSDSVLDFEEISLAGLGAGEYLVQVIGYSGATNPEYSFSIEAPTELVIEADRLEPNNSLEQATLVRSCSSLVPLRCSNDETLAGTTTLSDLTIHDDTDQDYFKFTTVADATQAHGITLAHLSANGSLDMKLLDTSGQPVTNLTDGTGPGYLSLDGLETGTYFVQVFGDMGETNAYDLTFDVPTPPGQPDQADAWTVMVYITASDLESFAHSDVNEMEQAVSQLPGSVNIAVLWDQSSQGTTYATGSGSQAAWGTAGRSFITADTNPNQVATSFELIGEQNTGDPDTLENFILWAADEAPAEHYALILWDHGSGLQGFNYDNLDAGSSDNLTTSELVQALEADNMPDFDLISFDACLMAMAEVGFSIQDLTDVYVSSQEVVGGNGHDYRTLFSVLESNPSNVTAAALGTGFVASYEDQYQGSNSGWDTHSAIETSAYDDLASSLSQFVDAAQAGSATDMDALGTARNAAVGYYISNLRDLGGFMQHIHDNASVTTSIRDAASDVLDELSDSLISKASDSRNSSGISIFLPSSSSSVGSWYTSGYSGFDNATDWSSLLTAMGSTGASSSSGGGRSLVVSDWGEQNNVPASAHNLNAVIGAGNVYDGLSLHSTSDVDWFRFTITGAADGSHDVYAIPTGANDSLRLELYNGSGNTLLGQSASGIGLETLSLDSLAAGTYLIRVDTTAGETISDYRISIDAPNGDPTSDWAGDNSSNQKAYGLGVINNQAFFSGLGIDAAPAQDWFTFDTPRLANSTQFSLTVALPAGTTLAAEIRDANGGVVSNASGQGSLALDYLALGTGETYTLLISGGGQATAYSLRFAAEAATTSVDLDASGQLLITDVSDAGQDDNLTIWTNGGQLLVTDPDHVLTTTVGTSLDPNTVSVPLSTISTGVLVQTGDGDDSLEINFYGTPFAGPVSYNAGNDLSDALVLASGMQWNGVTQAFTATSVTHDAADDTIDVDGMMIEYSGIFSIADGLSVLGSRDFQFSDAASTITLANTAAAGWMTVDESGDDVSISFDVDAMDSGSLQLHAGDGSDVISVTSLDPALSAALSLLGEAGNDTIQTSAVDYAVQAHGGSGNDLFYTGGGEDVLNGSSGDDTFNSGAGNDRVIGGSGRDLVNAGDGDDFFNGQGGQDIAYGDAGNDRLNGGGSNDRLYGNAGDDRLNGDLDHDVLNGGSGNDTARGGTGNDRLFGGSGRDWLDGGSGGDWLQGQGSSDTIRGGGGGDQINGGAGTDEVYEYGDVDFELTSSQLIGQGSDQLTDIEQARLVGGIGNNRIDASLFEGRVVLFGLEGNDSLYGGNGSDGINGGTGDDWLVGGNGDDRMFGGSGDDSIQGNSGNDYLRGQGGQDKLAGQNGDDTLNGEAGNDMLGGGIGNDVLRGGSGDDAMGGQDGDDRIYGQSGSDSLCSGTGVDVVVGTAVEVDNCLSSYDDWIDQAN